ncbi:MAG: hypothetical protein ACHREM_15225, partial [Polyangiales bacterium]
STDNNIDEPAPTPALTPEEAEAMELCAYLDGELDPASTARIEAKIKADPAFVARVKSLSRALDVTGALARQEADALYSAMDVDGIAGDVMKQIEAAKSLPAPVVSLEAARARKSKLVWVGVVTLAAAAAALIFVGTSNPPKPIGHDVPEIAGADRLPTSPVPSASDSAKFARYVAKPGDVEIDNLEVGEGASVIVSDDSVGTPAVVWVQESREGNDP